MITSDSFSTGSPTFLPSLYVPKMQTFGHLPLALLNKLAEADVPWAPGNHTGVHNSITYLTSMLTHRCTPSHHQHTPTNMQTVAPPFSAQHRGTESFHTPFSRTHTHVHTASQDSELLLCPRGGRLHCPPGSSAGADLKENKGRADGGRGAEPPASSSLAMLVCLGSTATASSGSDCRVNHSDDLNNYRLLKREKNRGINKQRREQPPDFSQPWVGRIHWGGCQWSPADPKGFFGMQCRWRGAGGGPQG